MGGFDTADDRPLITVRPFFALSVAHDFPAPRSFGDGNDNGDDAGHDPEFRWLQAGTTAELRDVIGGFLDRAATAKLGAAQLQSIRAAIPLRAVRERFDRLFRHQDGWLHDSIAWALSRDEALQTAIAEQEPAALHEPNGPDHRSAPRPLQFSAPLKLGYLLYQERKRGGAAERYAAQAEAISPACSHSAERLSRLLEEAEQWYADVLAFVVFAPWIADERGQGVTLAELLRDAFPPAARMDPFRLRVEACGAPDAYVAEGYAPALLDAAAHGDNDAGFAWLAASSPAQKQQLLTEVDLRLRGLTDSIESGLRLQDWREMFRSGVVRDQNLIRFDIGNAVASLPELALHEMMHLAYAGVRPPWRPTVDDRGTRLLVRRIDRSLDEGIAELFSGAALRRLATRYPLVTAYRRLRFALLRSRRNDPHIAGHEVLRRHRAAGRFADAEGLLRYAEAADHELVRMLEAWGEQPLPRETIDDGIAAVPEMQIAIGDRPELTSFGFRRQWCELALRGTTGRTSSDRAARPDGC
jgi:hypothetical protein